MRHGTTNLYAALDVHDGQVIADTYQRRRAVDFIDFLDHLDEICDNDVTLHMVMDNGWSHTANHTKQWLNDPARKDRFQVHHTPTHASWLNQIELFFSILSRGLLDRGQFDSVDELVDRLIAFVDNYNTDAQPFAWTYQGKPLKAA